MALFENIHVNQEVEVRLRGAVYDGKVKYKGGVATKDGDWVGVALLVPAGDHDGLYRGRRYFQCPDGHGIFVRASNIRFPPKTSRKLRNTYRTVNRKSTHDELLFGHPIRPEVKDGPRAPVSIDEGYSASASVSFARGLQAMSAPRADHRLRHSISRVKPAATMARPFSALASYTYRSAPVSDDYDAEPDWTSRPSIRRTHMPESALANQVRRGWDDVHWVRELSVPSARDSMKRGQWNDISY